MIQVYGCFTGWWSHAQVSRGVVAGLHANGLQNLAVKDTTPSSDKRDRPHGLEEAVTQNGHGIKVRVGRDSRARIGIYIGGYPPFMGDCLARHNVKVGMFICESAVVPSYWATLANTCDLICVPSQWCFDAYARAGVLADKMMVVRHGLHPIYSLGARANRPPRGKIKLLHITGARDFAERKGTAALVEAVRETFRPEDVSLRIRTPDSHYIRGLCMDTPHIDLDADSWPFPPASMFGALTQGWHALVAPSRGEAFGMLPLEARAVGLPVIATHCSGHAEHGHECDTVIPHGADESIRVNGIVNGMAPAVTAEGIAHGLRKFITSPLKMIGRDYAASWTWQHVTRALARRIAGASL